MKMVQAASDNEAPPLPFIEVVPLGKVSELACSVAAANLLAVWEWPARLAAPWPNPDYAYLPNRNQFDAGRILNALSRGLPACQVRLALTALDICLPILSYVFGEAVLGGRVALVSLARLSLNPDGRRADQGLFLERLAKICLHETAHSLGLSHCREPGCLMRFSPGISNVDALNLHFCPSCLARVAFQKKVLQDSGF
jgi:archaemetzincin